MAIKSRTLIIIFICVIALAILGIDFSWVSHQNGSGITAQSCQNYGLKIKRTNIGLSFFKTCKYSGNGGLNQLD